MTSRAFPAALAAALCILSFLHRAHAAPAASEDDSALFQSAVSHMHEGRPGEAIADFEALADRGVIDATVSFDRGLAYVERVRVGGEQSGDLGQAAQGLSEAKELTRDRALAADATRALALVRTEVARRRARAGEPVDFDPGLALGPSFLRLLSEDTWSILAIVGSVVMGAALFALRAARDRRGRIAATVTASVGMLVMILGTVSTFASRHERLTATRGIIVSAGARPADERGIVVANAPMIPEAAEVVVLEHRGGWANVRWGNQRAWIPATAVRAIAER
jgi:hypothetical protein